MPEAFVPRLSNIFDLPNQLDSLSTPLDQIWEQVGLKDFSFEVQSPPWPSGAIIDEPPLSEEEALEGLEWFEGEPEEDPPPIIPEPIDPAPVISLNPTTQILRLQLQCFSNIEVDLTGLKEVSFVLNPGGFEANAIMTQDRVLITFTMDIAVRFKPGLLRPMRKITGTDGRIRFEPDNSRTYTQISLGRVTITFDSINGINTSGGIQINLTEPVMLVPTGTIIETAQMYLNLSGHNKCLALTWTEANVNSLLKPLLGDLSDQSPPVESIVTLRVSLSDSISEIRLDWETQSTSRILSIPRLKVTTPENPRFSLLLFEDKNKQALSHFALVLRLKENNSLKVGSSFAWLRDDDRELQNDDGRSPDAPPLIELNLIAQHDVDLVLVDLNLAKLQQPLNFLQQLTTPLPVLDFTSSDQASLCKDLTYDLGSLKSADWTGCLKLSLNEGPFKFPFLRLGRDQFIQITALDDSEHDSSECEPGAISLDFDAKTVEFWVKAKVKIDDGLDLETSFALIFDWARFAFEVNHSGGIHFFAAQPYKGKFLDINWLFKSKDNGAGRYHLFTLVTQHSHYQLVQAPGSEIELSYDNISDQPVTFLVKNFVLSPKGISLESTVKSTPVKLFGLNTPFVFTGSGVEIVGNEIQGFTLAGSGALPPALVGESQVNIGLKFERGRNGNLILDSGWGRLETEKPLYCPGTLFEFRITKVGLKFERLGKLHFYFTLSGSAQFKPPANYDGPLALLPKIKIELVDCPLTGDARAIMSRVKFLVPLPKPISFNFLGCFEMELRGFGFLPQADVFDGDGAMWVSGQLKFAQGDWDIVDPRHDYHSLYIGLPGRGGGFPRIHFDRLAVNLNFGPAFRLNGVVHFINNEQRKGFEGGGELEIQGLPSFAGAFSFLRVRQGEGFPWLRAWFIYLEMGRVSFVIPILKLYLREVGLGFGYRFTLVGIKAADEANDARELIRRLDIISRTQGNLTNLESWSVDLENPGQDPRWTIVLRAMIAQNSAAATPVDWKELTEKDLSCIFLFDVVIAFRSDFTFLMTGRGWLNTNYWDYRTNNENLRHKALFSGYIVLSPRRKRFLARVVSNPNGAVGPHPPLPDFVKTAIASARFSATLLLEPGLLHYELGWPEQLRWRGKLGPLKVEFRGGFIFRISKRELVIGSTYKARGSFKIEAEGSVGIAGASIKALAEVAFGAKYIGVLAFKDVKQDSAIYAAIGLEIRCEIEIKAWLNLLFSKPSFKLSVSIYFSAQVEVGLLGNLEPGVRCRGTIAFRALGRRFGVSVELAVNKDAVIEARKRTHKFLYMGLEGGAVDESLLGFAPDDAGLTTVMAAHRLARLPAEILAAGKAEAVAEGAFEAPGYTIFVVEGVTENNDPCRYFVLFPQGEDELGGEERGFLPTPPDDDELSKVETDFILSLPANQPFSHVERFDPIQNRWVGPENGEFSWRAKWETVILTPDVYEKNDKGVYIPTGDTQILNLAAYLRYAYKTIESTNNSNKLTPVSDPDPIGMPVPIADERVHHPSEGDFEAAVRGAYAQFRGSPFFKPDPAYEYDGALQAAFREETTIYAAQGIVPASNTANTAGTAADINEVQDNMIENQRADQVRGLIIQDFITDVKDYAATPAPEKQATSVPFQMGLVFRVTGLQHPVWLNQNVNGNGPTIHQRQGVGPGRPGHLDPSQAPQKEVRTFNLASTNFETNPPQFERVRHYTDTDCIAITWDLTWPQRPDGCTGYQVDPEHHLIHYRVLRRPLDSREREETYTVKRADVLHREANKNGDDVLKALQPRFQIVDYFTQETAIEQAAMPATGYSYLYTITPVDFAGHQGQPLTIVATRYPSHPPQAPLESRLIVRYQLTPAQLSPAPYGDFRQPPVMPPAQVHVEWFLPKPGSASPLIPAAQYKLFFRRVAALPIGSYGLDSVAEGAQARWLANRPLPTDIELPVEFDRITIPQQGLPEMRQAVIPLASLRQAGILPDAEVGAAEALWQPEAWQVFMQAISVNGVPSALAPVQLLLRVEQAEPPAVTNAARTLEDSLKPDVGQLNREERLVTELEWLPHPIQFPMLPPEDMNAASGPAHFLMPKADVGFKFNGNLENIAYRQHPAGIRCISFRWNQGPSFLPDYPLDINAGYYLYELDLDAHTTATFTTREQLAQALRQLQEIQMLPVADLPLTPSNTLTPNQWEAWYPSAVRRFPGLPWPQGVPVNLKPWYSWRESYLEWPAWPGLTNGDAGYRTTTWHPALQRIIDLLDETYNLDLQATPPFQPVDFAGFIQTTAPQADPYGWGVLQRLGLSVAFILRDERTNEVISGDRALAAVKQVLDVCCADLSWKDYCNYLHVELLFQPGRSISLKDNTPLESESLLALVQLSLRPLAQLLLKYAKFEISGPPGGTLSLVFNVSQPCSLINLVDPAAGQAELNPRSNETTAFVRPIKLSLEGKATVLLRSQAIPTIGIALIGHLQNPLPTDLKKYVEYLSTSPLQLKLISDPSPLSDQRNNVIAPLKVLLTGANEPITSFQMEYRHEFSPEHEELGEYSTNFTLPTEFWAAAFSQPGLSGPGEQWLRFKRYVEALNSTDLTAADLPRIELPTAQNTLKGGNLLPNFMAWSYRFLTAGAADPLDSGPWLVTAYPRAGSPAYTCPDDSGRLTYFHLLEDQWAHAYRYYLRPYSRYDRLWRSLRQAPLFAANLPVDDSSHRVIGPDPLAGGLDVVLERLYPVEKPIVLSSRRLDRPSSPGSPAPPGKVWEVIVAQHPEQVLIERNQTLVRRLAFRQIAFTLLRRFNLPDWIDVLRQAVPYPVEPVFVRNDTVDIPGGYTQPIRILDIKEPDETSEKEQWQSEMQDEILSLGLPQRLPDFQQGALVLQWTALPFYYEHRLLLVAQTASNVSPITVVTQRDFEYRSPLPPETLVSGVAYDWEPKSPYTANCTKATVKVYARQFEIHLCQLWDSLPLSSQEQWADEKPDPVNENRVIASGPRRKLSALPDLEVVYQIIERSRGNIEVQAEFFFDHSARSYQARQLGQHFWAAVKSLLPPATDHANYRLNITLQQITEVELARLYDKTKMPESASTRCKVHFKPKPAALPAQPFERQLLSFVGVLTRADRDLLLINPADELRFLYERLGNENFPLPQFLDEWYATRAISKEIALPAEPTGLKEKLDFPESFYFVLAWDGSKDQAQALKQLKGDSYFIEAVSRIIEKTETGKTIFEFIPGIPTGRNLLPDELKRRANFEEPRVWWQYDPNDSEDVLSPLFDQLLHYHPELSSAQFDSSRPASIYAANYFETIKQLRQFVLTDKKFTEPYDEAIRPHPDSLKLKQFEGKPGEYKFSIDIVYPPAEDKKWTLRWRGAMNDELGQKLKALPGDKDFKDGVIAVINEFSVKESQNRSQLFTEPVTPATKVPAGLSAALRKKLGLQSDQTSLLQWTGPMTVEEENGLAAFETEDTFGGALKRLINKVKDGFAVSVDISFAWPRLESDIVQNLLRKNPPGLQLDFGNAFEIDESQWLRWAAGTALPIPVEQLEAALDKVFEPGDPFINAFKNLLHQISSQRFSAYFWRQDRPTQAELQPEINQHLLLGRRLIRCHAKERKFLTNAEQQTLLGLFVTANSSPSNPDQASLERLFEDLQDFQTLDELYQDWFSQEPVSRPILPAELSDAPDSPHSLVRTMLDEGLLDFIVSAEGTVGPVLIRYHGLMDLKEGQALQSVYQTQADKDAIQRLYDASMGKGLRDRALEIRTRRGSAAPSAAGGWTPVKLTSSPQHSE